MVRELATEIRQPSFLDEIIENVMVKNVKTVEVSAPLSECVKLMFDSKIGSLVIVQNGTPVGIFTDKDLVRAVASGAQDLGVNIASSMSKPLTTISSKATLMDAITLMGKLGIRHLLVVDSGRLAGIVSARDVFRLILSQQSLLLESVGEQLPVRTREQLRGLYTCLQDY